MAGIGDDDIRRVREANDIVAVFSDRVPVRQKGRDFWCCCPIHEEKSPSCKLNQAEQLWHCFGCGAGGDVFSFIMQADNLDFPDAVRKLADRAGIQLTETGGRASVAQSYKMRLKQVCKETAAFYHLHLMRSKDSQAAHARSYLGGRGLGGDVPKKWQLGFAAGNGALASHLRKLGFSEKEMVDANVAKRSGSALRDRFFNRIMFPISDVQGEVIAFGGRVVDAGEPKYLNSQETPIFRKSEVLYGLDKAKAAMASTGVAVVVEGYTDVITLHEAGITNAVATLGTALTGQHIRSLSRHAKNRIVYLFDGDEAGQRAADRALEFIDENMTPEAGRTRIELAAVTLPGGLDPADFVAREGADALLQLIGNAQSLIAYGIDRRLARYDLGSPEGRSRAMVDALSILAPIKGSLLAKDYAVQIAGRVRVREEDALERLAQLEDGRRWEGHAQPAGDEGRAQSGSGGQGPGKGDVRLPQAELNRRTFERELLSLCATNPGLALEYADALAQTQWHEKVHALLSEAILDTLAANSGASAAEVVMAAEAKVPSAASILTSGTMSDGTTPDRLAAFLAEELALGDMEEAINALNSQLKNPQGLDTKEYEMLFESVVAMQKELAARRLKHSVD